MGKPKPFGSRMRATALLFMVTMTAGCQSEIGTKIKIQENGGAVIQVLVSFNGDIAKQIQSDPSLQTELENSLNRAAKDISKTTDESGRLVYEVMPSIEEMREAQGMTGVADVAVVVEDNKANVSVKTVLPVVLQQSIKNAVANQPDAVELEKTMLANTFLEVRIKFPGGVESSNGGVVDNNELVYKESVSKWAEGVLYARGSLSGGTSWYVYGGIAVGVLILGGYFFRKNLIPGNRR
jgi:hypothetical protein